MSEFVPINTQEEFDAAIGERLKRERKNVAAQYADYEDLKQKVTGYETQIGDLTKERDALQQQVKGHETNSVKMRIAQELGIPATMASRLTGETEEDIRKDAESMASIFKTVQGAAPLYDNNKAAAAESDAALTDLLHTLRGD